MFFCLNADADVEEDHFRKSDLQRPRLMIGDGKDKFLILSDEKQFEAQNLTIKQQQQPGKMQPKEAKYCTLL